MALNNLGLGFVFTARNLASGTIGRLRGQMTRLGVTSRRSGLAMKAGFATAAAGIAPLLVGIGLLGGAMSLARAAAQFEQGIQRVANISGAAGEELRQLRDAAIQAGIATSFSPDEAVEGLTALAAQGFDTATSINLLNQALALAEAGQIGVEDASRATASAIRVFNLQGREQQTVADRLLKITNMTALQAGDLTLALGTVSRGASQTGQSLDEMLISMGLVRNAGLDVSVAASAVSSGLQFIAKNAQAFETLGVAVEDSNQEFRGFLDIVADADAALRERFPGAADRAREGLELFGRFGVAAFANISNQLRQMVEQNPEINNMQDAIKQLRQEMSEAEGTAEEFRDRLLDTFAGQARLLQGTVQTLAVVLGEPFAKVFKPIVKIITDGLNAFLRFFNALPDQVKITIAAFVVFAGVAFTLVGILTIFAGLLVVIAPFFLAILKIMIVLTAAMFPLVLAFLALGAAVATMWLAAQANLGGFGDFVERTVNRVKLVWRGLTQLFTQGGFSGELREEMNRAENAGIRRFVVNIFRIGSRLMEFFRGVSAGFSGMIKLLAPRFERLVAVFQDIGRELGFVDDAAAGLADTPMSDFASTGIKVGEVLVDILGFVVEGILAVANFVKGFVKGFKAIMSIFGPVFEVLVEQFGALGEEIGNMFRELGIFTDEGGSGWETFGAIVGGVIGVIATVIGGLLNVIVFVARGTVAQVRFMVRAWEPLKTFFVTLGASIAEIMDTIVVKIQNTIDTVLGFLGRIVSGIPAAFRPAGFSSLIELGAGSEARIAERESGLLARSTGRSRVVAERRIAESAAAERTAVAGERRGGGLEALAAQLAQDRVSRREEAIRQASQPIVVQIDGETVATATARADRTAAADAFTPAPADAT